LQTTSGLSERLLRTADLDDAACIEALAADRGLLGEVIDALPRMRVAAVAPALETGVKAVLNRRFQTYPQPVRADFEWAEFWADYVGACGELPVEALEGAMRAWVAKPSSQFLPKPGELRALALSIPFKAGERYTRLQKAVRGAQERAALLARGEFKLEPIRPRRMPGTAEEKDAVRTMAGNYVAQATERRAAIDAAKPKADFTLSQGRVGPSGLTAEMRRLQGLEPDPTPEQNRAESGADEGALDLHELVDSDLEPFK
jgi:hypothetical protein